MRRFVLIFRMDILTKESQPSKKQMGIYMQQWMEWINFIANKGQLADGGNHFSKSGKVLKPKNEMIKGPYSLNKESVAGYIIILANNTNDAVKLGKKCPILQGEGTSVEIREVSSPYE
jgi:hypothetical protein